jgi:transaldolase
MTRLQQLHAEYGQSPWLDNLTRSYLAGDELKRLLVAGIRGVTTNQTIFTKAILESTDYDNEYETAILSGSGVKEAYWRLVLSDIRVALGLLRPLYDESMGADGFVSVELDPALAADTVGTIYAARDLHRRIGEPNLLVKIPATAEGIPAIKRMIAEGRSVNVTLIFSLERYRQVIEAYVSGLEEHVATGGDPSAVHSVASFFLSRVDTEVDRKLEAIGSDEALALRGRAAIAQARVAYRSYRTSFLGERWDALALRGGRPQRPLWASTSTKSAKYPDTMYVDNLIGPGTVNTLPETTIAAFEDHGRLSRTIDANLDEAVGTLERITAVGVDLADVGRALEVRGVAKFAESVDEVMTTLKAKATGLRARGAETGGRRELQGNGRNVR